MKVYMKYAIGAAIVLLVFTIAYYIKNPLIPKIRIGDTVFFMEIAATPAEKEKGLGERDSLKPGWGMVFPYDHKERFTFWMKGMRFPLDFVWIADKKVVGLTENVPVMTEGSITMVSPEVPADQVFELNAGEINRHGIKIGDPVIYILK